MSKPAPIADHAPDTGRGSAARRARIWRLRDRVLRPGPRTLVMGVLNITPDSFSDGGRYLELGSALDHGLRLAAEGADLIDVGGESSRPGAGRISAVEERERVIPVIRALARATDVPITIDTTRAEVADAALDAGARAVNDISALAMDPGLAGVVARHGAGLILMHMRGTPETMQQEPSYDDLVGEVLGALRDAMTRAVEAGVDREAIALDPGIGFGKRLEHNLELLDRIGSLGALERPVMIGVSRKSFLGQITGRPIEGRLAGSLAAAAAAVIGGASVVRAHDVAETVDLVRSLDTIREGLGS